MSTKDETEASYNDLGIPPLTRFYAVCDANGPISVRLEGLSEGKPCRSKAGALLAFQKLDKQAAIDAASIDMEDFMGIEHGEEMSEDQFAEVAILHGARRVKSLDEVHNYHSGTTAHLAGGWTLWEVPNFTVGEVEYFEPGEVFARYNNYTDSTNSTPLECEVRLLKAEHEGISLWSYLVMSNTLFMNHGVVFLTEEGARKAGEQYAKENHDIDKDGVRFKTLVYALTHEDLFGCEVDDEDADEPKPVVYLVETMPDHRRENWVVGNWGKYPTNGAWRGLVDDVSGIDGEGPTRIVRIATAEDLNNYRRFEEQ